MQSCRLDDVNPVFSAIVNNNVQSSEQKENEENKNEENQNENKENITEGEEKKEEGKKEGEEAKEEGQEEQKELSPQEELDEFLNKNTGYKNLYKMLKLGVPIIGVEQKARLNGLDMDLFNELVEKAQKVNPNTH